MVEWSIAAVLKTVDGKLSGGSNPSLCAKEPNLERDSRVGAVLREQNALLRFSRLEIREKAKDAVDNGGAGRAAKGANPSLCAKEPNLERDSMVGAVLREQNALLRSS